MPRRFIVILGFVLILLAALSGCGGKPTAVPTPTPDPGSPEGRGLRLFQANCAACHALQDGVVLSGPSLAHIAIIGGSRIKGMSAEDYIRQSIVDPNAYAIRGFETGTMRQDFAQTLTSDQVSDIVAFLMTQK